MTYLLPIIPASLCGYAVYAALHNAAEVLAALLG